VGKVIPIFKTKYTVGQLVHHRMFGYRGVIFDVDETFHGTEDWYENVALSRPPKDKPWYHVLVHGETHTTYVAERNLEPATSNAPIDHPMVEYFFSRFEKGKYFRREN